MAAPGSAPGAAEYLGQARSADVRIDLIDFTEGRVTVEQDLRPLQAARPLAHESVSWVDVDGIHQVPVVQELGDAFGIHPLSIEDVLDPGSRSKAEYYEGYVYVIVRMVTRTPHDHELATEQVSLFLGPTWVLTFQERDGDVWDGVRARLQDRSTRVRQAGPDYLAYTLLDAIVDDYTSVVEALEDEVEAVDALDPRKLPQDTPMQLHRLRRRLRQVRKLIQPLREAVAGLLRADQGRITPTTVPFLRDLSDNLARLVDDIDRLRETCLALGDLFQATADHSMNEEMRVLTVIATIFIPLTFITGLYGMNFDNMPELHSTWGYPIAIALMLATAGGLVLYFRKRGWL